MEEDYYKILGVERTATQDEIQKAYRRLARKHHPDMNPDDKTAKAKFQQIQKAYDVIGDQAKRDKYDRFGSAYEQIEAGGGGGGGGWHSSPGGGGFEGEVDFSQIFGQRGSGGGGGGFDPLGGFGDIFKQFTPQGNAGGQKRGRRQTHRGADLQHEVQIPFATSISGGDVRLTLQRGKDKPETLEVKIPQGIEDGQTIRLRGQGEPGGGIPGDLMLTVRVVPHSVFSRRGNDLIAKTPVTVAEAALGAKVDVPSPWGTISLKVPAGTSSGKRLRIKGQGVKSAKSPQGDLYAEIHITLPPTLDAESEKLLRQFDEHNKFHPREGLSW